MKKPAPFPLRNEDTAARPSPRTLGESGTTGVALVAPGRGSSQPARKPDWLHVASWIRGTPDHSTGPGSLWQAVRAGSASFPETLCQSRSTSEGLCRLGGWHGQPSLQLRVKPLLNMDAFHLDGRPGFPNALQLFHPLQDLLDPRRIGEVGDEKGVLLRRRVRPDDPLLSG